MTAGGGGFGQSVGRLEDPALLRGTARFVDDIDLPGTLEIAFLRSPFAHARIGRIDTTSGPQKRPAGLVGRLVRYIGTFRPVS